MNLPSLLPCMAIVVVGFSCTLAQGCAFAGGIETPEPRETEAQRGVAASAPKGPGRSVSYAVERSVETDGAVAAADVKTERSRRDESDGRFGVFMLFLQVLRGPK